MTYVLVCGTVIVIRSNVERCDDVDRNSGILLIYRPKRYGHVASSLSTAPSLWLVQHVGALSVCEISRIRKFCVRLSHRGGILSFLLRSEMLVIAVDATMRKMMGVVTTVATSKDEEMKGASMTGVVLMVVFDVANR